MKCDFNTVGQNHFYFKLSSDEWWTKCQPHWNLSLPTLWFSLKYEGLGEVMLTYGPRIVGRNILPLLAICPLWCPLKYTWSCPILFCMKLAARFSLLPKYEVSLNAGLAKLTCDSLGDHSDSSRDSLLELRLSLSKDIILISSIPSHMPFWARDFNLQGINFWTKELAPFIFRFHETYLKFLFSFWSLGFGWDRTSLFKKTSTRALCFSLLSPGSKWELYFLLQGVGNTSSASSHILPKHFSFILCPQLLKPKGCMIQ